MMSLLLGSVSASALLTSANIGFDYMVSAPTALASSSTFASKGTIFEAEKSFTVTELSFWSEVAGASGEVLIAIMDSIGTITTILGRKDYPSTTNAAIQTITLDDPVSITEGDTFAVIVTRQDGNLVTSAEVSYNTAAVYNSTVDLSYATLKVGAMGFRRTSVSLINTNQNGSPVTTPWLVWFSGTADAPVTSPLGGVADGGLGVEAFGFSTTATSDIWVRFDILATGYSSWSPCVTMRSGGESGTLVAGLAVTGANNAMTIRQATGALATSYPFGFGLTDNLSDFGLNSGELKTMTVHIELNNATGSSETDAGNSSPTIGTIDTSGWAGTSVDWIGFCNVGVGTTTYSNVFISTTDPR